MMEQFTYKKKGLFNERLKYLKSLEIINENNLSDYMIHNHLPSNGLLGNKKAMFYMLQ